METNGQFLLKKDRPKIMLAARRRRLGSMPSRFPQTDEELRHEVLKRNAHASNSLNYPGIRHQEHADSDQYCIRTWVSADCIGFDNFAENEARCHSPDVDDGEAKFEYSNEDDVIEQDMNWRARAFSDAGPSSTSLDDAKLAENEVRRHSLGPECNADGHVKIVRTTKPINMKKRHENIYRGLVRTLLHPLGTPDHTTGLRPGDLLDHLREVFDVDREDHEVFIREEMQNRPSSLQVHVGLLEANGLKSPDSTDDTLDTYCVIGMHHPTKGKSPRFSPKSSPYHSPAASPSLPIRGRQTSGSLDVEEQRTSTIRNSPQPKWNEEFVMDIEEFWHDEIHVNLCSLEQGQEEKQPTEKQSGLKNLLGFRKHSEHDKSQIGVLGKIVIPVKNISCLGTDDWYDFLTNNSYSKHKAVGKCHIRLGISYKQNYDDGVYLSTDDYYQAYRQFLSNTYTNTGQKEWYTWELAAYVFKKITIPKRHVDDRYGLLSIKDYRILKMFAQAHGISNISQAIVKVICLLELHCDDNDIDISETALHQAIDELRMTWATMQIGQKHLHDKMPLTDTEISHYRRAASRYIHYKCDDMTDLPALFPPSVEALNNLKKQMGITVQLLGVDLWESSCIPQKDISKQLLEKLQIDVNSWITDQVETLISAEEEEDIKDIVIPQIERLIDLVEATTSHCSLLGVVKQYYSCLGIHYYRVSSYAVEKLISSKSMEIMLEMNKYMKRYSNYQVNILVASKLTLKLYLALRRFHGAVRDNVSRREIFRLPLFHYQEWFEESMIYWLQTFRSECVNRMEKALEIDKDLVVVTALVKYSHSSVDVLSCFASVIEEWRKIDVHDPDCASLGVTKVTDIICDGARLYAEKIHVILERNGYYDSSLNAGFDVNDRRVRRNQESIQSSTIPDPNTTWKVTKHKKTQHIRELRGQLPSQQLCITLNNIEHVRQYLMELPNLLLWENVAMMISTRYNTDDVGNQAMDTLYRLINSTNNEILQKSCLLLRQIAEKMRVEMDKYMELFTKHAPEKASSVDQFIGYLNTNMQTLHSTLMPDIYPHMVEQLWSVILSSFYKQLGIGLQTEYYDQIKIHLRATASFLIRIGLDEKKMHTQGYEDLKKRLDLNAKSTEDLILQYFLGLAKQMGTPTEYYGHLALKAAYIEETRGNVTIYVKVFKGTDLPGLDASGLSDPYVEVSLQPHNWFGAASKIQKTAILKNTLNPTFNTEFQFPNIPKDYLKIRGCCILMSVLDHDRIGSDDFAGEVVVHLPSLQPISLDDSIEKQPAVILPLKRPNKPTDGPYVEFPQSQTADPRRRANDTQNTNSHKTSGRQLELNNQLILFLSKVLSQREWDKTAKKFITERQRFIENQPKRTDKNKLTGQGDVGFLSSMFSNLLR